MSDKKGNGQLEPGEKFVDYTVVGPLGKGGMGTVYLMRAQDGMQYAVKIMDVGDGDDALDSRKRFLREAEFAIRVKHPNLIPVRSVGEDRESGLCYLVMDYMPGGSLADRLSKCRRLSVEESVSIAVQIAGALEVAHRHGAIHRDIKPENILFDLDGTPKLADMGVVKFSDRAHRTTVTTTGMIVGTPAYMAPEQMMDSHHVDARADIYSLGVVLYEMLTGSRPCAESTTVELLAKAIKGDPLPDVRTLRPEVSASLAYVLSLMCAPDPEGRPSSSCAVVELFMKAEQGTLEVPKEMLAPIVVKHRSWRKPLIASSAAFLASIVVVAVGWLAVKAVGVLADKEERQTVFVTNSVAQVVVVTNTTTPVETATAVDDYLRGERHQRLQRIGNAARGSRSGQAKESSQSTSGKADSARKNGEGGASSLSSDSDAVPDGQADAKVDRPHPGLSSKRRFFSDRDSSGFSTSVVPGGGGAIGADVAQLAALPQKPPVLAIFVKDCTTGRAFDGMADESEFCYRLAAEIDRKSFVVLDTTDIALAFKRCEVPQEERTGLIEGLFTGGSASRVARLIGADYILLATIKDVTISQDRLGDQLLATVCRLHIATKVIDATNVGDSVIYAKSRFLTSTPQDKASAPPIVFDKLIDNWATDTGCDIGRIAPVGRKGSSQSTQEVLIDSVTGESLPLPK